jgi:hypothetical protein
MWGKNSRVKLDPVSAWIFISRGGNENILRYAAAEIDSSARLVET